MDELKTKRLIYKSKNRGCKEMDILLGTFAASELSSLSTDELEEYERIINMDDIEIYQQMMKADPEIKLLKFIVDHYHSKFCD